MPLLRRTRAAGPAHSEYRKARELQIPTVQGICPAGFPPRSVEFTFLCPLESCLFRHVPSDTLKELIAYNDLTIC
ncbi:hypothetical protein NDU88_005017 [Pleurodeles waltl]|uniref:Uncharacterized protein n=1 Tax=Pleurodeles waltl TaxID=8319 RepID=A0AAV7VLK5_PLEWA|nr:hypothetical protein NDU88_005017 [Pleurodeles waltl]